MKQHLGSKSLIEKTFDGNTFKMKAASPGRTTQINVSGCVLIRRALLF